MARYIKNTLAGRIYKYGLDYQIYGIQELMLPKGAIPLHVAFQHGVLCLWCLVHDVANENRRFRVYGTGSTIVEDGLTYIGTAIQDEKKTREGVFGVWHVFVQGD